MRRCRIHVMGASGSGTSTLGRALAQHWSVPHADTDDYLWLPTNPPYVTLRPVEERIALMRAIFLPREAWVLSGCMGAWGDEVVAECDAVVFVTLEPEERMRRLEAREELRRAAGPVDEDEYAEFVAWARSYDDPTFEGRSRARHEAWLADLPIPVLRVDSAAPVEDLVQAVLDWEPEVEAAPRGPLHS